MKTLGFRREAHAVDGHRVRALAFEERSLLPVSAACLVASSIRETLGSLFGTPAVVKLYEPTIPSPPGWLAIARDARVFRIRASRADAALIVRDADASALAAAGFGEHESRSGPLSALERAVFERIIRAIAAQVAPVCGADVQAPCESDRELHGFTTFFELQVEQPVRARIGIALSRDPVPDAVPAIAAEHLLGLPVELAVRSDLGFYPAATLGALEPGMLLPFPAGALRGTLVLAGRAMALGECGVSGRRYALAIDGMPAERDEAAP